MSKTPTRVPAWRTVPVASIVREVGLKSPEPKGCHVEPLSALRKTPPKVAAYTVLGVLGSTARAEKLPPNEVVNCQLAPRSKLRYRSPKAVPAYTILAPGSLARAVTSRSLSFVGETSHVVPPFEERAAAPPEPLM